MGHRTVAGLIWAKPCPRPEFIPKGRLRGSSAQGITYERKVAGALAQAQHNRWFEYLDANGPGWCCPDLIIPANPLVVLEVKLTDTPRAKFQLRELYFPVLAAVFARPVRGVVVVKNLWRHTDQGEVVESLAEALARPGDSIPVIHWLGRGPL